MDEFESFMKKYKCSKCQTRFKHGGYKYICMRCYLKMCEPCYKSEWCYECGGVLNWTSVAIGVELFQLMDVTSKKNDEVEQKIAKLETENSLVKEEKEKCEKEILVLKSREDHHACIECTASESEQKMQLCTTCHEVELNSIAENVLCASCAIKKHMRKGHQTVDFYPFLRAFKYKSHSPEFTSGSENLKNSRDLLNMTVKKFNDLSVNASENFNTLTDMARRSNSTKNQVEFFEKIKVFVNESKLVHDNADSDLKKHTEILEKSLETIKAWYEERAGNCVDDSETVKDI